MTGMCGSFACVLRNHHVMLKAVTRLQATVLQNRMLSMLRSFPCFSIGSPDAYCAGRACGGRSLQYLPKLCVMQSRTLRAMASWVQVYAVLHLQLERHLPPAPKRLRRRGCRDGFPEFHCPRGISFQDRASFQWCAFSCREKYSRRRIVI